MFVSAIVVAGGLGARMRSGVEKPFVEVCGVPMVLYSVQAFQSCEGVSEIVLVLSKGGRKRFESLGPAGRFPKLTRTVLGGPRRQDSVFNGLHACDERMEIVVIHDAVRPMLRSEWVASAIEGLGDCAGAIYGAPVTDTLKRATADGIVQGTVSRENLYEVQTPQVFKKEWLLKAHEHARAEGLVATDDAALVEAIGGKIRILRGHPANLKVTFQDDLVIANALLSARSGEWFGSE